MREYETIEVKTVVIKAVNCDKCGKKLSIPETPEYFDGCEVVMSYGYGSDRDGGQVFLDLCNKCADEIIENLKLGGDTHHEP